jgi:hypothetical protein
MDVEGPMTIGMICNSCKGRRYINGELCRTCGGDGAIPVAIRMRSPRKVALRNLSIAVVIVIGILAAILVFT